MKGGWGVLKAYRYFFNGIGAVAGADPAKKKPAAGKE